MRQTNRRRKLLLARQTIRELSGEKLTGARAGLSPPGCGYSCGVDNSYSSEETHWCWFNGSVQTC